MKEKLALADTGAAQRRNEVAEGVSSSLAVGLGLFPLGMALGVLVTQAGLPWWVTPALSFTVFAGSMELLLVGMLATATPIAAIAVATFLVNSRHLFYAFSFPIRSVKNPVARAYAVYALTDEAYALTAPEPAGWTAPKLLAMQVSLQGYWVAGGFAGMGVAALLPAPIEGFDFALTALFVTLTLDAARSRHEVPSLLLAGASFAVAFLIAEDRLLLVALVLYVTLLLIRYAFTGRREAHRA